MVTRATAQTLLRPLLKSVSRSFYLTLAVVPGDVRAQVGAAYLLARATDTIADTDLIERPRRLQYLARIREWIMDLATHREAVREVQAALLDSGTDSAERALLSHLEECGALLESFAPEDQALIRRVLGILTQGMQKDLTEFPGANAQSLAALKTMADLDLYTYNAAGCVGEFWTRLMCAHRAALRDWDVERMAQTGVRFGKGLQYTNVLRDIPADLRRGRCYIPIELLEQAGLKPADLLDPAALPKFKPLRDRLLRIALEHLDQGWLYTMAIPCGEVRLRLACAWPILFAVKTLQRISVSESLLDPGTMLKMSRGEVYRIMALTAGTLGCARTLTAYYGHLRKRVAC
ncbi:MAG: squalene/phytoene synthase family protein [Nitrospirae bacterium]|nr:MAG: squalene/phytoene synthase family protein [Nitrospirota bacterium]